MSYAPISREIELFLKSSALSGRARGGLALWGLPPGGGWAGRIIEQSRRGPWGRGDPKLSQKHRKMALFGLFLEVSHAGSLKPIKNTSHSHRAATAVGSMTKSRISVAMASYKSLSMSYCCLRYDVPRWRLGARIELAERRRPQSKLTSPNMSETCAKRSPRHALTSACPIMAVSALILVNTGAK